VEQSIEVLESCHVRGNQSTQHPGYRGASIVTVITCSKQVAWGSCWYGFPTVWITDRQL
jgi:hypothetical protein